MITNRAYIKIDNIKYIPMLNEILNNSFENADIHWENDIAFFTTFDNDAFHFQLSKISSMIFQDFPIKLSILIVPFFNDIFKKYFSFINNDVVTISDVFLKNIDNEIVKKDAKKIQNMIEKNDLDTLRAFLMCNANSCSTANELFIHRNTLNYRVEHLEKTTNINIRDLNTLIFIKLILNICA